MISTRAAGGVVTIRLTTSGSGYSSAPSVTISGGGGTGASAVAYMAGTRVSEVVVTNPGSGYTSDPAVTVAGNASAVAHAATAGLRTMRFLRSRQGVLVGVDGMGRGIRWDGTASSAQPVGLLGPQFKPTVVNNAGTSKKVASIEVFDGGSGYYEPPTVTITGGTPTTAAKARAIVANGRVTSIEITNAGSGYQGTPTATLSGGNPSGAAFAVEVSGKLSTIEVTDSGSGYTSQPSVTFAQTNGLTGAAFHAVTDGDKVTGVVVTAAGTGATAAPVLSIDGNASVSPRIQYAVSSVSVVSGGQGFQTDAAITFTPDPSDTEASAAAATASASGGALVGVTLLSGGSYSTPPTASISGTDATLSCRMSPTSLGKYACAVRYVSEDSNGSRSVSSISEIAYADAGQGSAGVEWSLTHGPIDDRVTEVELWRSTGDQEILLYRVGPIPRAQFPGTYVDTLSDNDLIDVERSGYGLLPVTLPSGQVNARRFGVPPGNFAVGVMFQDRAWYAVDTTGQNANSLYFSEVDEPESVPSVNELIVQESVADSDEVVTLVPLSSSLLILQRRHMYKLQYVAQPVIDASILLAAYRGVLNENCCDVMGGVAFVADSHGLYAYDGNLQSISAQVDDYWRDGIIDFSKSSKCFVKCDESEMVCRFFYCEATDTEPVRALCYSVATKAWWKEEYAFGLRSAGNALDGSKHKAVYGTSLGGIASHSGASDDGAAIPYSMKTGNFPLAGDGSRAVGVLYTPTEAESNLRLELFYNGASTNRSNAVAADRGGPFVADEDGGLLDMQLAESHLADSVGYAKARYSGRGNDMSSGADRHVAVRLSGSQSTSGQSPVIHTITIEGAGG